MHLLLCFLCAVAVAVSAPRDRRDPIRVGAAFRVAPGYEPYFIWQVRGDQVWGHLVGGDRLLGRWWPRQQVLDWMSGRGIR